MYIEGLKGRKCHWWQQIQSYILQKRMVVLSRTGKCILGHKYKTHKQIAHKTLNFNHLHQLRLEAKHCLCFNSLYQIHQFPCIRKLAIFHYFCVVKVRHFERKTRNATLGRSRSRETFAFGKIRQKSHIYKINDV